MGRAVPFPIVTIPHAPTYIPVEVCSSAGLAPSTPIDQCLAAVKADVAADGVAAPATDVAALQKVVASAKEHGIDLKVVVMDKSPAIDTPLRDIATEIGQDSPGSTVLVLSPGWAGTYSTTYDRVILEAGQDVAKTAPNPVVGTQAFVDQLQTPDFPWMGLTITLVIGVAVAAVLTRVLQLRARRSQPSDTVSDQGK
ncbi:hypothetical protein MAIC_24330 [Mycolicibacterium aichiense]|uniref:Transmembrane protein n=1 Tax=Mycolicibacterium aichiense TaxID=1799 RepID=A0AAD1HLR3_9MYCO|nr:hypothetical protein MAIC_24330 [Mycolicibacterium aichiense]STZ81443.1 Conserved membrane protein of uncharacterised function [Mycolicibacterium aichiense]